MTAPAVSLLFGIPVDPDEVRNRLAADGASASDYLATKIPRSAQEADFQPGSPWAQRLDEYVGRHLADLSATAASLGVDVRRQATLDDLKEVAHKAEIIIILSHWKGAGFSNDDFLPGFDERLPVRLAEIDHPLAQWMFKELTPKRRFGLWKQPPPSPREVVRQALTATISEPCLTDARVEQASTTASRRRDLLDTWFCPFVAPGNRLELFDGMHTKDSVAAAVSGFRGLIDLTVCQSTYLGDHIAAASGQTIRTVQFLHLQEPIDAAFRLRIILTQLSKTDVSWHNYLMLREMTNAALKEEAALQ